MTEEDFKKRCMGVEIEGKDYIYQSNLVTFGGSLRKDYVCLNDDTFSFQYRERFYNPDLKKTPKDSQFFEYLFERLKTGESSFRTYLGDLPVGENGHIPSNVNCFIKGIRGLRGDYGILGEVASPRIADLLGVDTIYNTALAFDDEYDCYDRDDDFYYLNYESILSVDATPPGYTFQDMDTLGIIFSWTDESLKSILNRIEYCLKHIVADKYKLVMDAPLVKQFMNDFVKQYLFKIVLCSDGDFWEPNVGVLIGQDGDFKLAPMFDFEHMFDSRITPDEYYKIVKTTFDFCQNNGYADVLQDFMQKLEELDRHGTIDDILTNTVKVSSKAILNARSTINSNIRTMQKEWWRISDTTHELVE